MSGAISVQHGAFGRAALYQLDKEIITHAHREAHLIFYVDGVPADVQVGNERVAANHGNAVAVSPWVPHSFHPNSDLGSCICLVLYIKPMWFLENSISAKFPLSFGKASIPMTSDVQNWVHKLINLMLEDDASQLFDGYLFEMTRVCFGLSNRNLKSKHTPLYSRGQFMDFRVRRSLRLMQDAYCECTDIDWLAKESGLSRPHYFKLFKKQMGVTPNLYMNTLRAEHAISDLTGTDKSITEIGFDLGFSSQASFTRFFSSNVGIPPSDYRRVAASI